MSRAVRLALFALLLAAGAPRAHAIDCPPLAGPSDFAAVVRDDYFGDPVQHVYLSWTPPEFGSLVYREAYRIERRDDTAGGEFETIPSLLLYADDDRWWNFIGDPFDDDCTAVCAQPGHTYTYRLVVEWRWSSACDGYVSGQDLESPSNEVQVTIPGGAPVAPVPTNVRAVADTTKPRVKVVWDAPEGQAVDRYVIERRVAGTAGPGAKDFTAFERIATVAGEHAEYLDRSADPETESEYRVAAMIDGVLSNYSQPDPAFLQGTCTFKANFSIWDHGWVMDDSKNGVFFTIFKGAVSAALYPDHCTPGTCDSSLGYGPRRLAARKKAKFQFRSFRRVYVGDLELEEHEKGTVTLEVETGDPFSVDTWRRTTLTLASGDRSESTSLVRRRTPDEPQDQTTVCGLIGAGKKEALPGEPVTFLFRCFALGPQPLYAKELQIHVRVENGVVDKIVEDRMLSLGPDPADPQVTRLEVGALGPETPTRSEEASVLILAKAAAIGQLRVTATFVDVGPENVIFGTPRKAEVLVVPAPAAKSR